MDAPNISQAELAQDADRHYFSRNPYKRYRVRRSVPGEMPGFYAHHRWVAVLKLPKPLNKYRARIPGYRPQEVKEKALEHLRDMDIALQSNPTTDVLFNQYDVLGYFKMEGVKS